MTNAGWKEGREVILKCEGEGCDFETSVGKEAMTHAWETGHQLSGPGAFEGTIMTVSVQREDATMQAEVSGEDDYEDDYDE